MGAANRKGATALHSAAQPGQRWESNLYRAEVIRALVEGGADVNAKTVSLRTPLMIAANKGHLKAIHALLSAAEGVIEVDARSKNGHTALMFAYNGKNQVQTLMDKYSDYMKNAGANGCMDTGNG